MLPLFKVGLGGRSGSRRQWMSWVALEDEVRAIRFLLEADLTGPVNSPAPNPLTHATFAKPLGPSLHSLAVMPFPSFGPTLLIASELAQTLLFFIHRVIPSALTATGIHHHH